MTDGDAAVERLLKFWDERGIPYLPGVALETVRAFERQSGILVPEQLRAFYRATNGLRVPGSSEADDRYFDFWPIDELCRVRHAPSMVFFADVMQAASEFAVEVDGTDARPLGSIYHPCAAPVLIAPSFASFVDLYIADDDSLYFWNRPEGTPA